MPSEKSSAVGKVNGLNAAIQRIKVLVTHTNVWDFTDESTGEQKTGVTVSGALMKGDNGTERGWPAFRNSVALDEKDAFPMIPAIYSCELGVTKKGVKCTGFKFEQGLELATA